MQNRTHEQQIEAVANSGDFRSLNNMALKGFLLPNIEKNLHVVNLAKTCVWLNSIFQPMLQPVIILKKLTKLYPYVNRDDDRSSSEANKLMRMMHEEMEPRLKSLQALHVADFKQNEKNILAQSIHLMIGCVIACLTYEDSKYYGRACHPTATYYALCQAHMSDEGQKAPYMESENFIPMMEKIGIAALNDPTLLTEEILQRKIDLICGYKLRGEARLTPLFPELAQNAKLVIELMLHAKILWKVKVPFRLREIPASENQTSSSSSSTTDASEHRLKM